MNDRVVAPVVFEGVVPTEESAGPDSKGISFQMPLEDYSRLEEAMVKVKSESRSIFIRRAIAYYAEEIERLGERPTHRTAQSQGDKLLQLFDIMGINKTHWMQLQSRLVESGAVSDDSLWIILTNQIARILS